MRAMILPVAALLLAGAASLSHPAAAQGLETGGISITRGGGNVNTAAAKNSFAGQAATTIGGIGAQRRPGRDLRRAQPQLRQRPQQHRAAGTTTVGGTAFGRGAQASTFGGLNSNDARGFGSLATQSTTTLGGQAFGRGAQSQVSGGFNSNLAAGRFSQADQQVLTMGGIGDRPWFARPGLRRQQPQRGARPWLSGLPAGRHRRRAVIQLNI